MNVILICLLLATLMPILAKGPLAFAQSRQKGGYNNKDPRAQQALLTGFGARAKAAHENCFEALILFTPGVMAVLITQQVGLLTQYLCLAFILARFAYLLAYWLNYHIVRSTCWGIGFLVSLALICVAIF